MVLKEYREGYSASCLAKKYNLTSKCTVKTWEHQSKRPKLNKRDRPKKNKDIDYKERYEILKKY